MINKTLKQKYHAINEDSVKRQFNEEHKNCRIKEIRLIREDDFNDKAWYSVRYTELKAKYKCQRCGEKIFGIPALVNKKYYCQNSCFWQVRNELRLKSLLLKN